MKKIVLIATLFLAAFSGARAQQDDGGLKRKDRVKALYVAFITERLSLTGDEAQKFWPVYNQYDNEIQAVKKDLPELEKQQVTLNIKKRYQDNFTKILGSTTRCEQFYKADAEFKQRILEMIKKRQENKQAMRFRGGGNGRLQGENLN